jgi:caffeoyl-CoA O-methyltransferase
MVLFLALLSVLAPEAPTPEQLLARHVEASGGEAALRQVTTVIRQGTFEMHPGMLLPVTTHSKAPGKWQFRFSRPNVFLVEQSSDGPAAWDQNDDSTRDLKHKERRQADYAFDVQFALRAPDYFSAMKTTGKRTVAGRELWVVEAEPRGGDKPVEIHVDAATGFLVRAAEAGFEDYRKAGAVTLPYTLLFFEEGEGSQRLLTTDLKLNAPVEDWRFDRKESAAAFQRDLDAMWRPQVEEALRGIDPGPARAVLNRIRDFTPQDGRILYDLIVSRGYRRAIEVGTAKGNSGLWIALALKKTGGKLITIDIDADAVKTATANFRAAGLADVVECRHNDAFKEIPALEGEFDFLFLDTGTRLHKKFMDLVYPARLKDGGAIVSHNANGLERGQPDFYKAITEDPKLETKITRTPGGGVVVSVRK